MRRNTGASEVLSVIFRGLRASVSCTDCSRIDAASTSAATSGLCKTASSSDTDDRRSKVLHLRLIPTTGKMP